MDVLRCPVVREIMVLASIVMTTLAGNQEECLSEAFPTTQQFSLRDDIMSLEPDISQDVGYLVIVPEMRFNCHGYIRGWSALTHLNSSETLIDNLIHDITFQLWRPSDRGSGIYDFVGSHALDFEAGSLRNGLENVDGKQFFIFTSVQRNEQRLYFQPGDVIGWYIHTTAQLTEIPLSVAYRRISSNTSGDSSLLPVDIHFGVLTDTHRAHTQPPCELSLENSQLNIIPSVIPYVNVLVNTILPDDQPQPEGIDIIMCDDNANFVPIVITTTATTATPASTVSDSTSSETTVPLPTDDDNPITDPVTLTTGIVVSLVLVAIIFNTMVVLVTLYMKKRATQLNGTDSFIEAHNGIHWQAQYMENEPRYVENPH